MNCAKHPDVTASAFCRTCGKALCPTCARDVRGVPPQKKKLSYMEAREYATIEQRIAEAEERLKAAKEAFEDPAIASDASRLIGTQAEMDAAQKEVDELIARWAELEEKKG